MLKVSSHIKSDIIFFEYLKSKSDPIGMYFCKKHIPRMKIKLDEMMISIIRYIIFTVNLSHAVFLLRFLVA